MTAKLREGNIPNAKRYAGKVKRLALSLSRHGYSAEEALAFISSAEGITDDMRPELADWFCENLPKLDKGPNSRAIHEDCACCLGGKRYAEAGRIFLEEPTLDARIERLCKTPLIIGYCGERLDEKRFLIRFAPEQAYYRCSCLRLDNGRQKSVMPVSYCYCCAGHLKHHIEKALGCSVCVDVVTSSLTTLGKAVCSFEVTILDA